jgi:hypothetical protein
MKDQHKAVLDTFFAFFTVGTIISWIPAVAGIVSIVYYILRIWESETVKELRGRGRTNA